MFCETESIIRELRKELATKDEIMESLLADNAKLGEKVHHSIVILLDFVVDYDYSATSTSSCLNTNLQVKTSAESVGEGHSLQALRKRYPLYF